MLEVLAGCSRIIEVFACFLLVFVLPGFQRSQDDLVVGFQRSQQCLRYGLAEAFRILRGSQMQDFLPWSQEDLVGVLVAQRSQDFSRCLRGKSQQDSIGFQRSKQDLLDYRGLHVFQTSWEDLVGSQKSQQDFSRRDYRGLQ